MNSLTVEDTVLVDKSSFTGQLPQSRFCIVQTANRWEGVPAARKLRGMLVAGIVAWALFCGVIIVVPLLVVSDPLLRPGALAFSIFAVVLGSAFFGVGTVLFWRHRHTPLVADKKLGYLLYGNKQLCNLKDIRGFEVHEDRSGDDSTAGGEEVLLFEVRLNNGKAMGLPVWFAVGTTSEAEAVLAPLANFVGVELHIDKQ
jgi:hypothetical protein